MCVSREDFSRNGRWQVSQLNVSGFLNGTGPVLPAMDGGRIREIGLDWVSFGERSVLASLTGARDLRCLARGSGRSIEESVVGRFPRVVRRDASLLVNVVLAGTFRATFEGAVRKVRH